MPDWTPTLGAVVRDGATSFRVWAPDRARVELILEGTGPRPLTPADGGYWVGRFDDVGAGARYRYRLDGDDGLTFPDPASRGQPDGVHGPSVVVDPSAFPWRTRDWQAPGLSELVFYEVHIGTFTPSGTYRDTIERVPYLRDLGVSAIEIMPVADFPGDRNWGYDGVTLFAPARCYGTPDDLRALVDAAHARGIAVFLDVVYNHLGPDGAYAHAFSPYYFTERHLTAWGAAVNLDGPHSGEVRRFFIENALHWIHEYQIDGLRLDATHALRDDSREHFLAELTRTVRASASRQVLFVAEDHRNLAHMLRSVQEAGYGLDGVWADDFHHQVRVHTAGDREGYYADYTGSVEDLATTVRQGWFYTGQMSHHLKEPRGTSPEGVPPQAFVTCIQNHDQIGNRADGARLHHQVDAATYRATSALLLLAPQTPLLFMGQEWAASTPFLFFTDHHPELGQLVTEGRRNEFSSFAAFADPEARDRIPDPQAEITFLRSRLAWDEMTCGPHAATLRLYQRLLALRSASPVIRHASARSFQVRALDSHTLGIAYEPLPASIAPSPSNDREMPSSSLHVIVRLADTGTVTYGCARPFEVVLSTEDPDVAEAPTPIVAERVGSDGGDGCACEIRFARPGAIVLRC